MSHREDGRRRSAALALLAAAVALVALSGCLPPLNRSGEPIAPVPDYVKSVKIDPRTLEPIDDKPGNEETDGEKTGGDSPASR